MGLLINPNVAYLLVVTAVMLMLLTFINPKTNWLKIGMAVSLVAAGYELVHLKGNPWAFAVVALSPLPLFIAIRQERVNSPLFLLTILMLTSVLSTSLWIRTIARWLILAWLDLFPSSVPPLSTSSAKICVTQKARDSATILIL